LVSKALSDPLTVSFYIASLLFFGFFRPELRFLAIGGEGIILMILALPGIGALFAAAWLLLSLGRDRLWLDVGGEEAPLKLRVAWTVAIGLGGAAMVVMIAIAASR
jgi:hypothetical protein